MVMVQTFPRDQRQGEPLTVPLDLISATGAGNIFSYFVIGESNPRSRWTSTSLLFGAGGASALDVELTRGAANRLDLAAGDSFRVPSDGELQFGADVVLDRSAANTLRLADGDSFSVRTSVILRQATANYTVDWADPAAARAVTILDPGGTDFFVFRDMTQTLAGKTLTTPTIAATGWANANHAHAASNSGGTVGTITGNAATATALATARAINGVDFDGTAPITVTAAAGTLSGATLAAGVTASSLTSFGTIASPAFSGTFSGTYTIGGTPTMPTTMAGASTFSGIITFSANSGVVISGGSGNTLVVDTTTLIVDASNDRVGIGAIPTETLHVLVSGATEQIARFDGAAAPGLYIVFSEANSVTTRGFIGYGAGLFGGTNDNSLFGLRSQGALIFATGGGSRRVIIDSGGIVYTGIFQIGGTLGTSATANQFHIATQGAASTTMYIGNASINVTSDERVKINVRPFLGMASPLLAGLEVSQWDSYMEGYAPIGGYTGDYIGFTAQNMQKVAPWAVNTQGDTGLPWQARYEFLNGLMVKGWQEHDSRLALLEQQVNEVVGRSSNGWLKEQVREALADAEFKSWLQQELAKV